MRRESRNLIGATLVLALLACFALACGEGADTQKPVNAAKVTYERFLNSIGSITHTRGRPSEPWIVEPLDTSEVRGAFEVKGWSVIAKDMPGVPAGAVARVEVFGIPVAEAKGKTLEDVCSPAHSLGTAEVSTTDRSWSLEVNDGALTPGSTEIVVRTVVDGKNGWPASVRILWRSTGSPESSSSIPISKLRKGDIILMHWDGQSLWEGLWGYWTHAAIYWGADKRGHVLIEAVGSGKPSRMFPVEWYDDPSLDPSGSTASPDDWAVIRVNATDEQRAAAADYARNRLVGIPYPPLDDEKTQSLALSGVKAAQQAMYDGLDRNKDTTLYCSALVWQAWSRSSNGAFDLDSQYQQLAQGLSIASFTGGPLPSQYCVTPNDIYDELFAPSPVQLVASRGPVALAQ